MRTLEIIRHGPKNNDPKAHGTGVEAQLDPEGLHKVIRFASERLDFFHKASVTLPEYGIFTTPIDRAKATGQLIADVLRLDPVARGYLRGPVVEELVGSSGIGPTGQAVNLAPREMSRIWGNAKTKEEYASLQSEDRPLLAWLETDPDETFGRSGISVREIAYRLGTFVHSFFATGAGSGLAISHSGDIEPFVYHTLAIAQGKPTTRDVLVDCFSRYDGAIAPLHGVRIVDAGNEFLVEYTPKNGAVYCGTMPKAVFEQQAQWLTAHGKSASILERKISKELE